MWLWCYFLETRWWMWRIKLVLETSEGTCSRKLWRTYQLCLRKWDQSLLQMVLEDLPPCFCSVPVACWCCCLNCIFCSCIDLIKILTYQPLYTMGDPHAMKEIILVTSAVPNLASSVSRNILMVTWHLHFLCFWILMMISRVSHDVFNSFCSLRLLRRSVSPLSFFWLTTTRPVLMRTKTPSSQLSQRLTTAACDTGLMVSCTKLLSISLFLYFIYASASS